MFDFIDFLGANFAFQNLQILKCFALNSNQNSCQCFFIKNYVVDIIYRNVIYIFYKNYVSIKTIKVFYERTMAGRPKN